MSLPSSLCEPECVLPEQFFAMKRPPLIGETALMLAVLKDAVEIFQKYAHSPEAGHRVQFEEALGYLDSDDTEWPYSAANICDVLGIDLSYLRRGLKKFYGSRRQPRVRRKAKIIALTKRKREECALS